MTRPYITQARLDHVYDLAPNMREADVIELWSAESAGPLRGLMRAYRASSHCWVTMVNGSVQCMFGLIPFSLAGGSGVIWMLGSDLIHRHWLGFLRCHIEIMPRILSPYPHLFNYVAADNNATIKWLEWMGAEFQPAAAYGDHGRQFRRFDIRSK